MIRTIGMHISTNVQRGLGTSYYFNYQVATLILLPYSDLSELQQSVAPLLPPPTTKPRTNEVSTAGNALVPPPDEKTTRFTTEERRQILLKDPRVAVTEPHRALCALCQQWIKLKEDKAYIGHNFFKHADRCERKKE